MHQDLLFLVRLRERTLIRTPYRPFALLHNAFVYLADARYNAIGQVSIQVLAMVLKIVKRRSLSPTDCCAFPQDAVSAVLTLAVSGRRLDEAFHVHSNPQAGGGLVHGVVRRLTLMLRILYCQPFAPV